MSVLGLNLSIVVHLCNGIGAELIGSLHVIKLKKVLLFATGEKLARKLQFLSQTFVISNQALLIVLVRGVIFTDFECGLSDKTLKILSLHLAASEEFLLSLHVPAHIIQNVGLLLQRNNCGTEVLYLDLLL